ncbi:uncharacterized protein LOC119837928 [Zerene cesonia]|uniref:uncharacterized protein LOC119837928 n=1 Tax=Zerene cesonia TaxID=33412 RepID=UPI0018E55072|nr:uncharacterized protein LOC119837928 [Zerene cesonia]
MSTIVIQRELVVRFKKETLLNIGLLSKLQPMLPELSRLVFKDNAMDKPTQNLFNHLSYYLVSIIDAQFATTVSWPLYDTKTERAYRNELYSFISDYSSKGMLSPVMSSYLVNPSCYKVTVLIFQMSQLAVKKVVLLKMQKDSHRKLYEEMTEKYESKQKDGFLEAINKETEAMLSKFSNYLCKRRILERIAEKLRKRILEMEEKITKFNAQKYINDLVDRFVSLKDVDDVTKEDLLKVKNVHEQPQFFENWLNYVDSDVDKMQNEWDANATPFLNTSKNTSEYTEALIMRYTGQMERSTYMIEYNPKTDKICTNDLQSLVNSEQKYILRNIEKDGTLSFPNLIRAFVISICFVLRNNDVGDQIYKYNDYLQGGRSKYNEIISMMRVVMERIMIAEAKLQISPLPVNRSLPLKNYTCIPPMPDLSALKNKDHIQALFDSFTPLAFSKQKFNLRRNDNRNLNRPFPKSLITPFHHAPRDDFMRSIISYNMNTYDHINVSRNSHNISVMSQMKANETIAECASGFTKQQIQRLLSTKKTSSSKKYKYNTERPDINIKKGGLFNESSSSIQSNGLTRSYSSPNLYENRPKKAMSRGKGRKLSIMKEDSPFEVSGISALENDSNFSTLGLANAESSRKYSNSPTLPTVLISSDVENKINTVLKVLDSSKETETSTFSNTTNHKSMESQKTDTPKTSMQLIKKTSSIEKIINRFKKVRASVMPEKEDIITIREEKEKHEKTDHLISRVLLPDLLSPSCPQLNGNSDFLDQMLMDDKVYRKPRESLGTALGVDQTFLDQFDLID